MCDMTGQMSSKDANEIEGGGDHLRRAHSQRPLHLYVISGGSLVFDVAAVSFLSDVGIVGQLCGTLPAAPQQNRLLGMPLRLSVYETMWLVDRGLARLVDANEMGNRFVNAVDHNTNDVVECLIQDFNLKLDVQRERRRKAAEEKSLKHGSGKPFITSNAKDIAFVGTENEESRIIHHWNSLFGEEDQEQLRVKLLSSEIGAMSTCKTKKQAMAKIQLNYAVFKYLKDPRSLWILPGLKFGGIFVAYPGDPLQYHSKWIVETRDYENEDIGVARLANRARLASSTNKKYLICGIRAQKSGEKAENQPNPFSNDTNHEVVSLAFEWAGF